MLLIKKSNSDDSRLTPAALIDVVFLLLIFFMVASKFKDVDYKLETPISSKGGPQPVVKSDILNINIAYLDEKPVFYIDTIKHKNLATMESRLMAIGKEINPTEQKVMVNPQKNVPFEHVIATLNSCKKARLISVSLKN